MASGVPSPEQTGRQLRLKEKSERLRMYKVIPSQPDMSLWLVAYSELRSFRKRVYEIRKGFYHKYF
jgi:hypothetical protein